MCLAKCSLLVKLSLHGGNSVQKKRCVFFFLFVTVPESLPLSPCDPEFSPSDPSISMSAESLDFLERWESFRFGVFAAGSSVIWASSWNGDVGNGLCAAMPLAVVKFALVGVVVSSGAVFGG
jgi:hypothetical protein